MKPSVNRLEIPIEVSIKTNLNSEFDSYLEHIKTKNDLEIINGNITLNVKHDCDLDYLKSDLQEILKTVSEVKVAYKRIGYPSMTIAYLEGKVLENA